MNTNLNPEDFWPDAEKMLDKHFKMKQKRKIILWLFTALLIVGSTYYLSTDKTNHNIGKKYLVKENNITAEKSSSTNNSEISNIVTKKNANILPENSSTQKENILTSELKENTVLHSKRTITSLTVITAPKKSKINSINETGFAETVSSKTVEQFINQKQIENMNVVEPSKSSTSTNSEITLLKVTRFENVKYANSHSQELAKKNSDIKEPKSVFTSEYRLDISIGGNLVTKEISGYTNEVAFNKRNNQEESIITPQLSVELSKVHRNYALSIGLNYIQYGEKVNYDPTAKNKIAVDNSYWNTFFITSVVTDTNFVYGYVFYSQQTIQRADSNYVTQIDSADHIGINNKILKSTGTNIISYLEIPITASYYFGKNKFRYGISAGIATGFLVYSNGYYLKESGTDVVNIAEDKIFKKVIFNGQVGLDFRYCISPKIHLLLRPQYRMNLNSIFDESNGPKQKYSSAGVTAGISFLLK